MKLIRRHSREEPKGTLLFCFTNEEGDIIGNLFNQAGNVHLRVLTPKECFEVGFPFAFPVIDNYSNERDIKMAMERQLKERGYK